MAISPPFTAAKAVLVCSRSTDLQAIKVCGRCRRPPETAEKDETALGLRSVEKQTPISTNRSQIHITSHNRSNRPGMATIHHTRPPESSRLNVQK